MQPPLPQTPRAAPPQGPGPRLGPKGFLRACLASQLTHLNHACGAWYQTTDRSDRGEQTGTTGFG